VTDEALGRLWCERNDRRPDYYPRLGLPPWRWVYDDAPVYALPHPLWEVMSVSRHETEADAYAAVGAALRELKLRADEIAAVLDSLAGRCGDD
jgi:hypothetical protein